MSAGFKKFYATAAAVSTAAGYAVLLDGRAVMTPGRRKLEVPSQKLADAISAEWRAQGAEVRPETMPMTRLANTALDRVGMERAAVVAQIARYAASELLCYRASDPLALTERQAAAWDPWLRWAAERYGAALTTGRGVTFIAQPAEALRRLERASAERTDFELAGIGAAVPVLGSLVLALALAEGRMTASEAFAASEVDERFQREQWGFDAEAEARRLALAAEIDGAERFLRLLD